SPEEAPFRVTSSGGGKDLTVYYVQADIDILEEKEIRLKRAKQFVEWMASQVRGDTGSQLLKTPDGKSRMASYFEEQYINNPPGEYELTARYTPTTPDNWK